MNTRVVEAYLARLYADPAECARFLADPRGTAAQAGLAETEIRALEQIDRVGLRLASVSFTKKRALEPARGGIGHALRRFFRRA